MIIISGASRGIGNYLLRRFFNDGEDVIGFYNKTLPNENKDILYKIDISKAGEIDEFVKTKADRLNQMVLLNCAGANYNSFAHKADPQKWGELIQTNLVGTFRVINALLPLMREQNFGRIINFSSVLAQTGSLGTSAYAASKAGLWGMTKTIALENATKGITINNLNLGYFEIGMINDIPTELLETIKEKIPVKKFGNPDEIYKAVKFLSDSEYITGSNIDINGGLY